MTAARTSLAAKRPTRILVLLLLGGCVFEFTTPPATELHVVIYAPISEVGHVARACPIAWADEWPGKETEVRWRVSDATLVRLVDDPEMSHSSCIGFRGLKAGTVTITGVMGSLRDSATVRIIPAVARIVTQPGTVRLRVGESTTVLASIVGEGGETLSDVPMVWLPPKRDVVRVTSTTPTFITLEAARVGITAIRVAPMTADVDTLPARRWRMVTVHVSAPSGYPAPRAAR